MLIVIMETHLTMRYTLTEVEEESIEILKILDLFKNM